MLNDPNMVTMILMMKKMVKYKLLYNRDVFHSYSIDEEEWNKARFKK